MHWGGVTPRFSPEDFKQRSMFGVGTDWPISYEDLDPFYQEAEVLMGVAGEQGPPVLDPRGKPFPMPPLPLTYNLQLLKGWAAKAGIAMWSQPSSKTPCNMAGDRRAVAAHLLAHLPDRQYRPFHVESALAHRDSSRAAHRATPRSMLREKPLTCRRRSGRPTSRSSSTRAFHCRGGYT
jgi:choline dehydrogenase-like flavoprotein